MKLLKEIETDEPCLTCNNQFVMMLRLTFIFILLNFTFSCSSRKSQKDTDKDENITYERIRGNDTWGFVNNKGDTVIPLGKYEFLNPIDEKGMIFAKSGDKFGYIDIDQNVIIPFDYEEMSVFSYGLTPAKKNGKYGYINRNGEVIIPFQYNTETHFYPSGLAIAQKNDKFGFIDTLGNEVIPIIYDKVDQSMTDTIVIAFRNNKFAFFSNKGKQMTDFVFDEIEEPFITINGRDKTTFFNNGLALVRKGKRIAYLDSKLNEVVPFGQYNDGEPFNNNRLAIVSKNGRYGVIDAYGKPVVRKEYNLIEHPKRYSDESELFVAKKGRYFQVLDKNARPISEMNIKNYTWDSYRFTDKKDNIDNYYPQDYFKNILIVETIDHTAYVLNEDGTILIPAEYQRIEEFKGKIAIAKKENKYGLIDFNNQIISPFIYDTIWTGRFFDYYVVSQNGKYGLIDETGNILLECKYQDISPCYYNEDNRYIVKNNGKYGIIDKRGNVIIPIEYDGISNWVEYSPPEHFVIKNKKHGLISREGKIYLPTVYDELRFYSYDLIKVRQNGKFGIVNVRDSVIIPIENQAVFVEFDWERIRIANPESPNIYVKRDDKWFIVNSNNDIIRKDISHNEIVDKFWLEIDSICSRRLKEMEAGASKAPVTIEEILDQ